MEVTKLLPYLQDYMQTNFVDLIVIDTGSEIHTGDENSAADMVVLMRALRLLAASTNCAVLVVQHVSKGIWNLAYDEINQASIRGSSVLVDKSRNVFMLARMPRKDAPRFGLPDTNDTHEDYVVLKHVKANLGGYVKPRVFYRTSKGRLKFEAQYVLDDNRPSALDGGAADVRQQTRRAQNAIQRGAIMDALWAEAERHPDLSLRERPSTYQIQVMVADHMTDKAAAFHIAWLAQNGYVSEAKDGPRRNDARRFWPIKKWDGGGTEEAGDTSE
jgi:hypothetical protein